MPGRKRKNKKKERKEKDSSVILDCPGPVTTLARTSEQPLQCNSCKLVLDIQRCSVFCVCKKGLQQ